MKEIISQVGNKSKDLCQKDLWLLINSYFEQKGLVKHQLDSFNNFIQNTMQEIVDDMPPVIVTHEVDNLPLLKNSKRELKTVIRLGQLHLSKPTFIEENTSSRTLLPNEARLRNLTYSSPLYCDISSTNLKIFYDGEEKIETLLKQDTEKVLLGRIPIMLKSRFCVLDKLLPGSLIQLGECMEDPGGYFIVNGSEKVIVAQEQLAWNHVYVFQKNENSKISEELKFYTKEGVLHFAECRSVAEFGKWSPSLLTVKIFVRPFPKKNKSKVHLLNQKNCNFIFFSGGLYLRVILPYFKKNIPITWIFKALGFENDKEILEHICYDDQDEKIIELVRYCLEDDKISVSYSFSKNCPIMDQETALAAIGQHVSKGTQKIKIRFAYEILQKEFLPHIGIGQGFELRKGFFFGYIISKLLKTQIGKRKIDDRDHYGYKRLDTTGPLLSILFRQLLSKVLKDLRYSLQKKSNLKKNVFQISDFIKSNMITAGIQYALATGNWGTDKQALRTGVSQVLNRLNYSATLSHLRRLNSPSGKGGKLTKPRHLHNTHWGLVCPAETPEGHSCGLVKNLALTAFISIGNQSNKIVELLEEHGTKNFSDVDFNKIKNAFKILINGCWIGLHFEPNQLAQKLLDLRRLGEISEEISIILDNQEQEFRLFTDSGRVVRPLLIINSQKLKNKDFWVFPSFLEKEKLGKLRKKEKISFSNLIREGVIEFLDGQEEEMCYIAMFLEEIKTQFEKTFRIDYTHCELHPSMILGVCAGLIPFCDHNQSPRNSYQAAMGKQAIGFYSMSFQKRMDTISHVLFYPQQPLVTTKPTKFVGLGNFPNGINAIVAVACYGGYNQEDSIIMSQDAIDRGIFRSSSFRSYKDEEKVKFGGTREKFEVPNIKDCIGSKRGSYEKLELDGLISEGLKVSGDDIIIGKTAPCDFSKSKFSFTPLQRNYKLKKDASTSIRSFEAGTVDKVMIGMTDQGTRLVKVRIRSIRIPQIGDKFASRHGQKGIIGMLYKQCDLPFTDQGISPDIIMNPHAIPSRMTIGHLLECLLSKVASITAQENDRDGTAFSSVSIEKITVKLENLGFQKHGWERMINGCTGKKLEASVFIGPTYYQRLKHMVEDKIHSRARGPVQILTRQPVEGRARDGGLRFGEMERDCMISHGAAIFLKDRLMDQSDAFNIFVCDLCGFLAIGNRSKNLFECKNCNNKIYISLIKIPYACKLLIQELMGMLIGPRIISESF